MESTGTELLYASNDYLILHKHEIGIELLNRTWSIFKYNTHTVNINCLKLSSPTPSDTTPPAQYHIWTLEEQQAKISIWTMI